jgi:hypothetical protein
MPVRRMRELMVNKRLGPGKLLCIIHIILSLLIIPSVLFGEEADGNASFDLTIQDNLISLSAQEASLKEIAEEIGRTIYIEVDAQKVGLLALDMAGVKYAGE